MLDNATLIQYNENSPLTMICSALQNIMHPDNVDSTKLVALAILKQVVDLTAKPMSISIVNKALETA